MGRLIEGEGQEAVGPGTLGLEGLLDPIHDGEFPGGGAEDREGSHREGGMDRVDPEGGWCAKAAANIARPEVADGPLADLAELGSRYGSRS